MKYEEFLQVVEERRELEHEEAERTAVTVLQALCDPLTGDEAFDLLAQLPAPLSVGCVTAMDVRSRGGALLVRGEPAAHVGQGRLREDGRL